MSEALVFVCSTTAHLASKVATCSKCGIYCFYTAAAYEYAQKKYKGQPMQFYCESCAAPMMSKQTDQQIRDAGEVGRRGLPTQLQWLVDEVEPEQMRTYFRKKIPQ